MKAIPPEKSGLVSVYWELTKEHRRRLVLGALAMLAVNLLGLAPPILLGRLIDAYTGTRVSGAPSLLAAAYVAVFGLQALLRFPLRSGLIGTSIRVAASLREQYADRILRVSRASLASYTPGDLMSRMTADLGLVEGALATGLPFLVDCSITLLILPAAMVAESPKLALAAFAVLPAVPIAAWILIPRISRASEAAQAAFGRLVGKAHENAVSVQTIRAYGLENREAEVFEAMGKDYVALDLGRARLEVLFSGTVQALVALSMTAVLGFGSREAIRGDLSAGGFVTFFQYAGMTAWPLTGLAWAGLLFRQGAVGLGRLEEVLHLPEEPSGGLPAPAGEGAIEIRNLTYTRPGESSPVLREISLSLKVGERVALVGPLGSGKSTLLHLLARLIEPPVGSVWMDGVDVTTIDLAAFRRRITASPQEPFLFSGTIRENLALTAPSQDALEAAARAARVDGPEFGAGLGTPVGEKGVALSGGQRQRVAIARALARPSSVLLLDDATSALDRGTQAEVFRGLDGRTVLFSTHRADLACAAERVVVLDEGRVVEAGSPAELLASGGLFSAMARKQSYSEAFDHA